MQKHEELLTVRDGDRILGWVWGGIVRGHPWFVAEVNETGRRNVGLLTQEAGEEWIREECK